MSDLRTLGRAMRDAQRAYWNATTHAASFKAMRLEAEAAFDAALSTEPAPAPDVAETLARIKNYLGNGGLFNPELMEHDKVRDLILDCRTALETLARERDALKALIADLNDAIALTDDRLAAAEARVKALRTEMERIADVTERWTNSLVSQVNEIARAAIIKDTADE